MAITGAKLLIVSGMAALLVVARPHAQFSPPTTNQIDIEYNPSSSPAHADLHEILRENRILEQLRDFLAMLVLPQSLKIQFDDCGGDADAWYDPALHSITICYEYIRELRDKAPKETTADGVTPEDAVIGPVMEVALHEVAHAVFDILKLPILGREEDAADQFAAVLLLQMSKETARRVIAATAHMYWREAHEAPADNDDFASSHSPPIQRFYQLVCIAYGWDASLFRYVREKYLDADRANECPGEVETLKNSFWKLMGPHIDESARRKMEIGDWMPAARRMLHGR